MLITVKIVDLESVIPIRHAVLRRGFPLKTCYFEEDGILPNVHFAAFFRQDGVDKVVGIESIYLQKLPGYDEEPAWRIRGMAVLPEFQGQGVGEKLMKYVIAHIAIQSPQFMLWGNVRKSAVQFYKKLNFSIVSDEFDVPTVGPHFKMRLLVS